LAGLVQLKQTGAIAWLVRFICHPNPGVHQTSLNRCVLVRFQTNSGVVWP